jgi:hypothetical protein
VSDSRAFIEAKVSKTSPRLPATVSSRGSAVEAIRVRPARVAERQLSQNPPGSFDKAGGGDALLGGGRNDRPSSVDGLPAFMDQRSQTKSKEIGMKSFASLTAIALLLTSAIATASTGRVDQVPEDGLDKATCSVTCDDGTSCSITRPGNEVKAERRAADRRDARAAVARRKNELLLLSPTISVWFQRLEQAEARGDQEGTDEALASIFAEAQAVGHPIELAAKVSCGCSGITGSQAQCSY